MPLLSESLRPLIRDIPPQLRRLSLLALLTGFTVSSKLMGSTASFCWLMPAWAAVDRGPTVSFHFKKQMFCTHFVLDQICRT